MPQSQKSISSFIASQIARTARAISNLTAKYGTGSAQTPNQKPQTGTSKKELTVTLFDGTVLTTVGAGSFGGTGPVIYMPPTSDLESKAANADPLKNSAVAAAVNWLKRVFSEAPIVVEALQKDGAGRIVPAHALTKLLDRPNPLYPGVLLKAGLMASWATTGNGYMRKVRARNKKLVELYLIRPDFITPVPDNNGFLDYYAVKRSASDQEPEHVPPADIVHVRWDLDPTNHLKGLSPLFSLLLEILSDSSATRLAAALVENTGVPSVMITPADKEVELDPNLGNDLADSWQTAAGGGNAGKPVVVGAAVNVEKISFSPAELDLKAIHRLPEERIAAVLGVPAIVLGLGAGLDASTYNNVDAARKIAYEACIIPMQNILAPQLSQQLLYEFEANPDNYRVAFDNSQVRVLQPDLNELVDRLTKGYEAGTVKRSEVREAQHLPVKNGVDDFYKNEIERLKAINNVPVADPAPGPSAADPAADPATNNNNNNNDNPPASGE